jgi:methionyl aminopeptidase
MIHFKTDKEIATMKKAGKILGDVLYRTTKKVEPGISELALDIFAEAEIKKAGGESGFKKVPGYVHTICSSTNDVVVHGIPQKRILNDGDIIGIDMGVYVDGFHTDMAQTVRVGGSKNDKVDKFLEVGYRALFEAIRQAQPGNRVGHISQTFQRIIEKENGYSVVKGLVGHGVGRDLHEDPEIPGYLGTKLETTPLLKPNMTIAIEIIYNMGKEDVVYEGNDEWTIVSKDGSLSGVFERSVVITKDGPELLTKFPGETI